MEFINREAEAFFNEEIRQIQIAQGGILSEEYNDYLEKKKSYYQAASCAISTQNSKEKIIQKRLNAIQSGVPFGERDTYSPDEIFPYRLQKVVCPLTGEIIVEDLSTKKVFDTNVMIVDIQGMDY